MTDPSPPPFVGLSVDQAMQSLSLETAKRRQIIEAKRTGSRLVVYGVAMGACASLAAFLAPADSIFAWAPWIFGTFAGLVGGFGLLRLFAAWQLGRR